MPSLYENGLINAPGALIKSVYSNQQSIIQSICYLHNDRYMFDVDLCFNIGSMYGDLKPPLRCYDIQPIAPWVIKQDYTSAFLEPRSVGSIVVDPPFIIGQSGTMYSRYGGFSSLADLIHNYTSLMIYCTEAIKRDGLLVFKLQDVIHNRRRFFTSFMVTQMAVELGWNLIDEFLYIAPSRPTNGQCTLQDASRSYHSKFLVFRFRRARRYPDVSNILNAGSESC